MLRSAARSAPNAPWYVDPQLTGGFEFVNTMRAQELEWGEGCRELGREATAGILRDWVAQKIDECLDWMVWPDEVDGHDRGYPHHTQIELGDIELGAPRTRRFAPIAVVRASTRRPEQSSRRRRRGRWHDPVMLSPRIIGARRKRGAGC